MNLVKQQRIKFSVFSTLFSAAILAVLLSGFFGFTVISNDMYVTRTLESALGSPDTYNQNNTSNLVCMYVSVDSEGNITNKADLKHYGDKAADIAHAAIATGKGKFKVGKLHFIVYNKTTDDGKLFGLFDRTRFYEQLVDTALLLVLLFCMAMILIFMLAYLASSKLLMPVMDAVNKQRDFVANASHELKTPLTIIATNLSVIKSEPQSTVEDNAEWIDSIDSQIGRMRGLIQNMLELNKLEQSAMPIQDVDLSQIADGACLTFEPVCFQNGVTLITEVKPDIVVKGDKNSLERLFVILLDNATKYCGENGKVGFKLSSDAKKATVTVMNTGECISKEDEKHVFDRFYRVDGARSDGQSYGLGLSIAEATVRTHGGTISCHGIEGKGMVFTVMLPLPKTKRTPRLSLPKSKTKK